MFASSTDLRRVRRGTLTVTGTGAGACARALGEELLRKEAGEAGGALGGEPFGDELLGDEILRKAAREPGGEPLDDDILRKAAREPGGALGGERLGEGLLRGGAGIISSTIS